MIPALVALDISAISVSLFLSYHVRFFSFITGVAPVTKGLPPWSFYLYALFFIVPLWLFIFSQHGFYRIYFVPLLDELIRVLRSVSVGIFFLILSTFFYRDFSFSRLTFLLFWVMAVCVVFLFRELFKAVAATLLRPYVKRENLLVVGKENRMLKAQIRKHPHLQVYYFPYDDGAEMEKLKRTIVDREIDQLILADMNWPENMLMDLYDWCENRKIDFKLVPNIVQMCKGEVCMDSSLGIPILQLKPLSLSGFNFYFKKILDLLIAIILLSFIWPVLVFIGVLIKIDSPGPFLYLHKRMGYRGKVFSFFKFRTMVIDADNLLEKFRKLSERKGPVFKMSNDPRVTRLGRFLRRYSIDEIPQLLNVLRGEMSLVGPRPQVLWEASAYDDWAKRRLRTLPGITGLWQISGRASLSYEEMIDLDIYYIENWSCGMDLKILFKTIPAIFSKRGAY
ncbi:MAG: sugar transferase [Endomicrobiales bacterium]